MRSTASWNISICLKFVPSFGQPRKRITSCLRSYWESSIATLSVSRVQKHSKKRRKPMFITKKHISRRAVLKAAGVTLGLPFLDAMVPAGTVLAQTAAVPKLRTGFFYIPHGAIMGNTSHGPALDKWTPSGSGADFKLSPILASLEPYKKYVTSFGNLENAASAGSVHTFNPATWLSATRPDTGAPRAHMAATLDQVIAKVIGQDTPLPSLEVASETIVQSAAGGGGSYTTLSFRDAESPLPMEP